MKRLLLSIIALISITAYSQSKLEKLKAEITAEGKKLYASEMASWYGTDLFLEKYKEREKIGGYFSYVDNSKKSTCVFYGKGDNPKIIGTMVFDETYNVNTADYNLLERDMSDVEKDYYTLRVKAQERIKTDTIFRHYKDTNLNIIPIIDKKEKKVYLITGYNGKEKIVVYGNDYLITFDKKNNIKDVRRLHASYLPFEYGGDKIIVSGVHSHVELSGDLISPTDICTTMLYEHYTKLESYIVISKKYVSIWNCKTDDLTVITTEAWEKIAKDRKK